MDPSVRLFRISRGDPATDLFVFSTTDKEGDIRGAFAGQDHGGMSFEEYAKTYSEGHIAEITEIGQVPADCHKWTPYLADNVQDDLNIYVHEFLAIREKERGA